jgi:hypothetical protein
MLVSLLIIIICFAAAKIIKSTDWRDVADDEEAYQYWKDKK